MMPRRGIAQVGLRNQASPPMRVARMEMDSHADTCCAGSSARVIEYTGLTANVAPFSLEYSELPDVPIVKAATAYDHPITGKVYILVMAQALWFGDRLENTLICPNQCRDNGVDVDERPRRYVSESSHSIYFRADDIRIELTADGYLSYLRTRTPTNEELESCKWLQLTEDAPWDPYSKDFARQEEIA